MADENIDKDLAALFAAEEAGLEADADAFSARVDKGIGRQIWQRRFILAGATIVGSLFAALQIPAILQSVGQSVSFDADSIISFTSGLEVSNQAVLIGAAIIAMSFFAALSAETA